MLDRSSQRPPMRGLWKTTLWLCVLVSGLQQSAWSQEMAPPSEPSGAPVALDNGGLLFSDRVTGKQSEAIGAIFRAGVLTGPAVGREDTLVPFEFMPYGFVFEESGMVFGDFRVFRSTKDGWGTNVGGGYRHYISDWDRIIGANFYYDYDNTSGALFRSVGFGLETYGTWWDARANAYFPQANEAKLLSTSVVPGSARFQGYNVLFDIERIFGEAMSGVDMEFGVPLPGRLLERMDARMYAGAYHFRNDSEVSTWGWKGRLQADVIPSLQLALEVTSDDLFDTNVVFGAQWSFGGYRQPDDERPSQRARMTTPVRRQYNVVVSRTSEIERDVVAVNPATGEPYFIEHVASYAPPGGDGTFENPFNSIVSAQTNYFLNGVAGFTSADAGAVPGDIIFTHADSIFDGGPDAAITLEEGVRLLGEGSGIRHQINLAGVGFVDLPRATDFANRPRLINGIGNGVTLANDAEFSGFVLGTPGVPGTGPTGVGIYGDSVSNVVLRRVDVNFAGEEGILLENTAGAVTFNGVVVNDPADTGLAVIGGTGRITFSDDPLTNAAGAINKTGGLGYGLLVQDTLANPGSFVSLAPSTSTAADINTTGVDGVLITNAGATVTVGQTNITDAPNDGITVLGGTANVSFLGQQNITNSSTSGTGSGITISDRATGANVSFVNGVTIADRNAAGIELFDNEGNIFFGGTVNVLADLSQTLPDFAAIDYQDSSGSVLFNGNVTINGSGAEGVRIGNLLTDNTGQFSSTGSFTILNVEDGIAIRDDRSFVQFNNVSIDARTGSGVIVTGHENTGLTDPSRVAFNGIVSVGNSLDSDAIAVNLNNNSASVTFGNLSITEAGTGGGLVVTDNIGSIAIEDLDSESIGGPALYVENVGVVTPQADLTTITSGGIQILDGTLDATNGQSAFIQNSVYSIQLTSVDNDGGDNGIRLIDNYGFGEDRPASFVVTGQNGAAGTGGTIQTTATTFDGVFAQNTGIVSLNGMTVQSVGGDGINAFNTAALLNSTPAYATQLEVTNSTVQGSGGVGIIALNVPLVNIENSIVSGSGSNEIFLSANVGSSNLGDENEFDGLYTWTLSGNTVTETQAGIDAIYLDSTNANASVDVTIQNSIAINKAGIGGAAIFMESAGPWIANISTNVMNVTGDSGIGIEYDGNSSSSNTQLNILSNIITGTAGDHTGIAITTTGSSTINVGNIVGLLGNQIQLAGTSDGVMEGMTFNLAANSNVSVFNNEIQVSEDGGQGIVFQSLFGPSNVFISGNNIAITNGLFGGAIEYGILMQAITGTVNLSGPVDNSVLINNNGGTFFFFQALNPNQINGQITVNGIPVP